jgi:hypothetical protein
MPLARTIGAITNPEQAFRRIRLQDGGRNEGGSPADHDKTEGTSSNA